MKSRLILIFIFVSNLALSQKYRSITGEYSLKDGPVNKIEVFEKNKKLFARAQSYQTSELLPTDNPLVFNGTEYGSTITFKENSAKIVDGGELYIQGQTLILSRIFPSNEDYLGDYKFSAGSPISQASIKLIDENLNLSFDKSSNFSLEKTSKLDHFLINGTNKEVDFIRNDAKEISAIMITDGDLKYEGAKEGISGTSENEYVGIYKIEDSIIDMVEIKLENGKLVGYSTEGSAVLQPTDKIDVFDLVGFQGNTLFIRDSNNKIIGIELSVDGYQMHGSKTK